MCSGHDEYPTLSTHTSNLCGPVEHHLRVDVGSVLADVVQQRAKWHERNNQHQSSCHTNGDDTQTIRMNHRRHYTSFVQQLSAFSRWRSFVQNLYCYRQLHVLIQRHPHALKIKISTKSGDNVLPKIKLKAPVPLKLCIECYINININKIMNIIII